MPREFDFISPDVLITEIDQSIRPNTPDEDGLVVIGTAFKGPAMQPIRVNNMQQLMQTFGAGQQKLSQKI